MYTEMFQWVSNACVHQVLGFFSPLYTLVSLNVVSVSDISAVHLIVGWCLFACSMNELTYFISAHVPE